MFSIKVVSQIARRFTTETVLKKRNPHNLHPKDIKIPGDIMEYFTNLGQPNILNLFPSKLLRKKYKYPDNYYVASQEAAKIIAGHLTKDCSEKKIVLESSPGPGLVTANLMKKKNTTVHVFESIDLFEDGLKKIYGAQSDHIKFHRGDLINLWKVAFQDRIDNGSRVQKMLAGLPVSDWSSTPKRLFAGVGSLNFFKYLISSMARQCDLFSLGRIEMFLVVPPQVYIHLTCSNQAGYMLYRANTVLFQIIFEHQFLEKLPKKSFLPWQYEQNPAKRKKLSNFYSIDAEYLYLVKITPRADIYELCPLEYMQALLYFVKQNCVSRKHRVIPSLEKWTPGCGPRLIIHAETPCPVKPLPLGTNNYIPQFSVPCTTMTNKDFYPNMNIFTEFGDLSPSQILTLFTQFRQWPEFKESPFLASLENSLLKMETSDQETIDSLSLQEEEDDVIGTKKRPSREEK